MFLGKYQGTERRFEHELISFNNDLTKSGSTETGGSSMTV